jgi:UDP-glucose 4-epimerase
MKILLTGGAGYIGSHVAVSLLERGDEIVIADNFANSGEDVIDRIARIAGKDPAIFEADLRDPAAVDEIFAKHPDIDAVIHLAGLKAVGESVAEPLLYYEWNLSIAFNLLNSMNAAGVKKLVFSSSATVYSDDNPVPFTEGAKLGASNPYGWTKVMIEQILTDLCAADKEFSVVNLRYFNPIGAHSSGLIGEEPKGVPNNLMPYIDKVAAGILPHISVFGDDYDTPDGTGVRDYIHVMDLADAHALAVDYINNERKGVFAFNIGTGIGSSVLDVIAAYEKAFGKEIPYVIEPRRAGDIAILLADPALAQRELGFSAKFGLDKMCEDSLRRAKRNGASAYPERH